MSETKSGSGLDIPKPDFRDVELFGGFEDEIKYDTVAFEAYHKERAELVEQGRPTFIVNGFFYDGFDASYFVDNEHVADIYYSVLKETKLFWVKNAQVNKLSLEEAIMAVKSVGYKKDYTKKVA